MRKTSLAFVVAALLGSSVVRADAPPLLPIQGVLADPSGTPLDGDYAIVLQLYDTDASIVPLYTESQVVHVDQGIFSTYLGDVVPLDLALFRDNGTLYLGITVGEDEEMVPRFQLGSSAFSAFSQHAATAGDAETFNGKVTADFADVAHSHSFLELSDVPSGLDDGDDDTVYTAGNGLLLANEQFELDGPVVEGLARGVCFDDEDELTAALDDNYLASSYAPAWGDLSGVPAGFADDVDNDTVYTAGSGLTLANEQFALDGTAVQVLAKGVCFDSEGELTAALDDNYLASSYQPAWGDLSGVPAGFSDNTDDVDDADADDTNELQNLTEVLSQGGNAGGGSISNVNSLTATRFFSSDNTASGSDSISLGGTNNTASGQYAGVYAGRDNIANGTESFVGGGDDNYASGGNTVVAGGDRNRIAAEVTCDATNNQSVNVGCYAAGDAYFDGTIDYDLPRTCVNDNTLCYSKSSGSSSSTISGGRSNHINNSSILSTISGGGENYIASNSDSNVIGGGFLNTIGDFASRSVIGGGLANVVDAFQSVVAGGKENYVVGRESVVGGGANNYAAGIRATIPGGDNNETGANYAFAAGRNAKALHQGSFVWGDSNGSDISSSTNNQFTARASGGFRFYTNSGASSGAVLNSGSGSWSNLSDRDSKENITPVDGREVLEALEQVSVQTWNYKAQDDEVRHMGPMAQDFHAAFGLGESERLISTVDSDGVCLAATKALYDMSREQESLIASQQDEIAKLSARVDRLESLVEQALNR